jgi:hypothetical protein
MNMIANDQTTQWKSGASAAPDAALEGPLFHGFANASEHLP